MLTSNINWLSLVQISDQAVIGAVVQNSGGRVTSQSCISGCSFSSLNIVMHSISFLLLLVSCISTIEASRFCSNNKEFCITAVQSASDVLFTVEMTDRVGYAALGFCRSAMDGADIVTITKDGVVQNTLAKGHALASTLPQQYVKDVVKKGPGVVTFTRPLTGPVCKLNSGDKAIWAWATKPDTSSMHDAFGVFTLSIDQAPTATTPASSQSSTVSSTKNTTTRSSPLEPITKSSSNVVATPVPAPVVAPVETSSNAPKPMPLVAAKITAQPTYSIIENDMYDDVTDTKEDWIDQLATWLTTKKGTWKKLFGKPKHEGPKAARATAPSTSTYGNQQLVCRLRKVTATK